MNMHALHAFRSSDQRLTGSRRDTFRLDVVLECTLFEAIRLTRLLLVRADARSVVQALDLNH